MTGLEYKGEKHSKDRFLHCFFFSPTMLHYFFLLSLLPISNII